MKKKYKVMLCEDRVAVHGEWIIEAPNGNHACIDVELEKLSPEQRALFQSNKKVFLCYEEHR